MVENGGVVVTLRSICHGIGSKAAGGLNVAGPCRTTAARQGTIIREYNERYKQDTVWQICCVCFACNNNDNNNNNENRTERFNIGRLTDKQRPPAGQSGFDVF